MQIVDIVTKSAFALNQVTDNLTSAYLNIPFDKLGGLKPIIKAINKQIGTINPETSPFYAMRKLISGDPAVAKVVCLQLGINSEESDSPQFGLFYGGELIPIQRDPNMKVLALPVNINGEEDLLPIVFESTGSENNEYTVFKITFDIDLPTKDTTQTYSIDLPGTIAWKEYSKDKPNPNTSAITSLIRRNKLEDFANLLKPLQPGHPTAEIKSGDGNGSYEKLDPLALSNLKVGDEFTVVEYKQVYSKRYMKRFTFYTVEYNNTRYTLGSGSYQGLFALKDLIPFNVRVTSKQPAKNPMYFDVTLDAEINGKWHPIPQWGSKAPEVLPNFTEGQVSYRIASMVWLEASGNNGPQVLVTLPDINELGDIAVVKLTGQQSKDIFHDTKITKESFITYAKIAWQGEGKTKQSVKAVIGKLDYPETDVEETLTLLMGGVPTDQDS